MPEGIAMDDSLYPRSPADVPADYIHPSKAYRRHAWLAVAGLVGFFFLYLGATAWFGFKTVHLVRAAASAGSFVGFVAAGLAGFFFVFLAKALLPSKRGARADRIEVSAQDQPQLFAFVHRIADEANAPRPHKVILSPDVNAAVTYELSLVNLLFPTRKNLLIGIGLVNVLTLAELKAVLAHEFGHFAQRAMAVGRWVYVGQQIAGRIIDRRDGVDRMLQGLSYLDIRISWIGWLLRIVAWAIRALTETFFRLVVAAERALSREMELQADRVSVSLAGSDALVHGLFRLRAADAAWGHVEAIAAKELSNGKRVPDLFAIQSLALRELRRIFGDEEFGDVPPLPEDPASHRVFTPQLAQPPVMWSTHPPSHEREANAKTPYVPAELDDRSAWCLFEDVDGLRARITARELESWGAPEDAEVLDLETSLALAEERFDKGFLESRYHGIYLGREITRKSEVVPDLYDAPPADSEAIRAVLSDPYPEALADLARGYRDLRKEKAQLRALEAGVAEAPGRSIQHRGQTLKRKELRGVITRVEDEIRQARSDLYAVDRRIRTAHWAAAAALGDDWANLHSVHLALLHFAEHVEANLDDAMGYLGNVFEVVTADGRITDAEVSRLLGSAVDVFGALSRVWDSRNTVQVGPAVAASMEIPDWAAAFDEEFALLAPVRENIGDWLSVVESWFNAYSGMVGRLRTAALEVLLDVEGHVRRCWLEGRDAGPTPQGPVIRAHYPAFLDGSERHIQLRLGWWDRFVTADGWVPGAARLVVASGIVGLATFGGVDGGIVSASVLVHNGLHRPVVVQVGDDRQAIPALSEAEFDLDPGNAKVRTETAEGELIEEFTASIDNEFADHVYSVAGAVPLVRWEVVYGSRSHVPEPKVLGAPRWLESDFDYVFVEPPSSIDSRDDEVRKDVLMALDAPDAAGLLMVVSALSPAEQQRVGLVHARWDRLPLAAAWLGYAHSVEETKDDAAALLFARRGAADGKDVMLERLAQDFAEPGDSAVCDAHAARWAEEPGDGDAAYLALRCRPEDDETAHATLEALADNPGHEWLMAAGAFSHYRLGNEAEALALLRRARRALPSMAEAWAPFEARLERLQAELEDGVNLEELEQASVVVRMHRANERGDEGASESIALLAKGRLEEAAHTAKKEQMKTVVLRLVATSHGATDIQLQRAAELWPDTEMGVAEAIAGIVIAHRAGTDAEPYVAAVRRSLEDDADAVLAFADAERLKADLEQLEAQRKRLDPELRGHAAVLGLGILGDEAPGHWAPEARRLLFQGERPYLVRMDYSHTPDLDRLFPPEE